MKFTILGIPPSVNHYWLAHGHRRFISKAGREYKLSFALQAPRMPQKLSNRLELRITWFRPDNRRRDADNVLKPILDCLTDCLIEDDSLIDLITIDKRPKPDKKNPRIEIELSPYISE